MVIFIVKMAIFIVKMHIFVLKMAIFVAKIDISFVVTGKITIATLQADANLKKSFLFIIGAKTNDWIGDVYPARFSLFRSI